MKPKKKSLIYLIRKESDYFWYFIDNLACKLDKLDRMYNKKLIGNEYRKEYRTIGISKDDKVLHVGCGAFPLTEITLAEATGANVVGIDKNPEMIKAANDIIHKKNLHDKIKVEHGNGIDYPVEGFDVIIVSSCVTPKVEIARHIFKNAKKNSKIVFREVDMAVEPLVQYIDLQKDVVLVKKIGYHPFPFFEPFGWQSFYLIKKQ